MELRVLILVDGTAHFGKGNEVMLPKLGAADAMAESQNPKVGRMEVGIAGTARHNGMAVMAVFYSGASLASRRGNSGSVIDLSQLPSPSPRRS